QKMVLTGSQQRERFELRLLPNHRRAWPRAGGNTARSSQTGKRQQQSRRCGYCNTLTSEEGTLGTNHGPENNTVQPTRKSLFNGCGGPVADHRLLEKYRHYFGARSAAFSTPGME